MASGKRGPIFISFKTEERDHARTLKARLEERGFYVWWQEEIQCGQAWHERIDIEVKRAACIVVLWSARSIESQWVKHEASQAIVRGVYAPARIELVEIAAPFDRLQATDLHGWGGDVKHAGFVNLMVRIEELVPERVSAPRRALDALFGARATILAVAVAAVALALLVTVTLAVSRVVARTDEVVKREDELVKREDELVKHAAALGQDVQRVVSTVPTISVRVTVLIPGDAPALVALRKRNPRGVDALFDRTRLTIQIRAASMPPWDLETTVDPAHPLGGDRIQVIPLSIFEHRLRDEWSVEIQRDRSAWRSAPLSATARDLENAEVVIAAEANTVEDDHTLNLDDDSIRAVLRAMTASTVVVDAGGATLVVLAAAPCPRTSLYGAHPLCVTGHLKSR